MTNPCMTNRAHRPLAGPRRAVVAAILFAVLLTTGWTPQQGAFGETYDGSGGRRAAEGVHPDGGAVRWEVTIPEDGAVRSGGAGDGSASVWLDTDGHVLTVVRRDTTDTAYDLVAFDRDNGGIAWTAGSDLAFGLSPACLTVDQASGDIWAIARDDAGGSRFLTRFDPATGAEDAGARIDVPSSCQTGLQLLPGGDLAFRDVCCEEAVLVYDLAAGAERVRYTPPAGSALGPTLLSSPDGQRLYVLEDADEMGPDLRLLSVDVSTGAVIDQVDLPGNYPRSFSGHQTYVDVDGGIVLSTEEGVEDGWVVRVAEDGAGGLDIAWQTRAFERDGPGGDDFDSAPAAIRPGGADERLVVVKQSNAVDPFIALDLADGTPVWQSELFPGGTVDTSNWLMDAAGNLVVSYFVGRNDGPETVPYDVFDGETGERIGSGPLGYRETGGAVLDDDGVLYLVVPVPTHRLVAIEPGDGDGVGGVALPPGVSRLDAGPGAGPADLAIRLCQTLFPEPDSARRVILAREDVFADALAGAPLAAGDDACILFTDAEGLYGHVRDEIARVLPDGGQVVILGGFAAISEEISYQLGEIGYSVARLGGDSRYETARLIGTQVRAENPGTSAIMLAFAGDWPDAITGGAYGADTGVPIILTDRDDLHPEAARAMTDLDVTQTFVLGGAAAVSDAVVAEVAGIRVSGPNRMGTAVAVAEDLWLPRIGDLESFVVVNLERADAWTLALAAAPLSARFDAPQLGVATERYPDETRSFLERIGFSDLPAAVLVGDLGFIGAAVEDGIGATIGDPG